MHSKEYGIAWRKANKEYIHNYRLNHSKFKYCKDDITKIENYDKAKADNFEGWVLHHRDEIRELPSGMIAIRSMTDLIDNKRYYNCPPNELIYMTRSEHQRLHRKHYRKSYNK